MKKRIIHIALGKANPERSNGVNKVVNSVITHQVDNGYLAELWGISFNLKHNYPERNYKTTIFQDYRTKFRIDRKLKKAISSLASNNTIVHLHGAFIPQFHQIARLLKKNNIPYFFTPHGGYNLAALQKSNSRKRIYMKLFERYLVNNAFGIQLLGKSEEIGTKKYFNAPLFFIPNGQEIDESVIRRPRPNETLKVGFLGRIDIRTKGLDVLLNGLANVKEKFNVQLEIVGDGGEIEELKKMVKELGLEQHVNFKGALYGNEKLQVLSCWDAMCLVSRNEGLPGVVLEAASVSVPSIVTQATNMGDYIRDYNAGWVINDESASELSEILTLVSSEKENDGIKKYGDSAKKMVEEVFDWNHISKQLISAYDSI